MVLFERRSGEISNFQFLIPTNCGVVTFSLQKVPKCADDSGIFPYLFCCANSDL